VSTCFRQIAAALDPRSAPRLLLLLVAALTKDQKTAERHFQESLALREQLYRESPDENAAALMLTLARCGQHRRAVELAEYAHAPAAALTPEADET
jgi:hypothetical protein